MDTKESRYRYANFAIYFFAALVNSLPVHTFSSINELVSIRFAYKPSEVTFNALIFAIAHPIFAYPCNWLLRTFGMQKAFIVGGALVIGGVWLRILIEQSIVWCLLGSFLCAVGNIFVLNSPSKVAINWFKSESIPNMIFLAVLANLISITLGASVPGLMLSKESTKEEIMTFLFVEAILVTAVYILLFIFFRDKPKVAPSNSAQVHPHLTYLQLVKQLFSNRQYLKLAAGMALNYGTLIAAIATLGQLLQSLHYSKTELIASETLLSTMIAGIFGNVAFSILLKKTRAYKSIAIFGMLASLVGFTLLCILFQQQISRNFQVVLVSAVAGFFMIPVPAITISFASELVFPIDEGSSAGYLFAFSQTFGAVVGFCFSQILENIEHAAVIVMSIEVFFLLGSVVMLIITKEDLKRGKFEERKKSSLTKDDDQQAGGAALLAE